MKGDIQGYEIKREYLSVFLSKGIIIKAEYVVDMDHLNIDWFSFIIFKVPHTTDLLFIYGKLTFSYKIVRVTSYYNQPLQGCGRLRIFIWKYCGKYLTSYGSNAENTRFHTEVMGNVFHIITYNFLKLYMECHMRKFPHQHGTDSAVAWKDADLHVTNTPCNPWKLRKKISM